jgi:hypothetical protein
MYLRKDGRPCYVGKGHGDRAFNHGNHPIKPPKDLSRVILLYRSSECEALATEIELIANWGRLDNNTGILRNLTDGGDNPPYQGGKKHGKRTYFTPGFSNCKHSSETRAKISATMKVKGIVPPNRAKEQ